MRRLSLILVFTALVCLPLGAQQMSMEGFTRLKGARVEKDRSMAILDLVTDQTGFTVLSNGNKAVDVKEDEGFIRLLLPPGTTRLSIRHPSFGQLSWAAPKTLRRNRHYQALLFAIDPTVDFKASHQWAVFHLNPKDVLVQIDSVSKPVRSSIAEYYLPVGEHSYRVEAPFYEPAEGSFTLSEAGRTDVTVQLQPQYSYLTVKTEWDGGELYIDGIHIKRKEATSLRLGKGYHHVAYFWDDACYYDSLLFVGAAQKKVLDLKVKDLRRRPLLTEIAQPEATQYGDTVSVMVPVKLSCKDPEAEILIDRETVGKGGWEGNLPLGFHLLGTRKDGQEGTSVRVLFEDFFPQEITLLVPGSAYGLVNVRCNVKDALILIDGEDRGRTPQLLHLDASRTYELVVYKPGYRDRKTRIRPKGNGQVDVYMQLKKR